MKTRTHISGTVCAIAAFACISTLSSCKLGHKYSRPDLNMPSQYSESTYDSICISELKWWEIYQDTLLQQLIHAALEQNKDILASEHRIKEMAARKRLALANMLPSLDGQAYGQREVLNYGGNNKKPDPEIGAKVALSWEVDLWGNKRWQHDQSIAQWLATIENRRALIISIIADVAEAYFELVALDNELEMVRRTLSARQEGVRLAKIRFEGGLTSETSYQQAQVEYARTATHVPVLERNIEMKQNEIAFLTGAYPHQIKRASALGTNPWTDVLPSALSSTLLERRPDIRAAEQNLIAANAAVGAAYTNRFPRLMLTAQGGLECEELTDLLRSPMHFLSAALTGPVFDMGRRQSEYRARQEAYLQQCYAYEKAVIGAFREVSDAITQFNKSKEIYESVNQLCEAARTTTSLAQLQYLNGVIGYIDLLDAQRSYFDAQVGVINAERDKRIALAQLYKSLGGGW